RRQHGREERTQSSPQGNPPDLEGLEAERHCATNWAQSHLALQMENTLRPTRLGRTQEPVALPAPDCVLLPPAHPAIGHPSTPKIGPAQSRPGWPPCDSGRIAPRAFAAPPSLALDDQAHFARRRL